MSTSRENARQRGNNNGNDFNTHFVAIGRHQALLRGLLDAVFVHTHTHTDENDNDKETQTRSREKDGDCDDDGDDSTPTLLLTLLLSQSREWGLESIARQCGARVVDVMSFSAFQHRRHGYAHMRTEVEASFAQRQRGQQRSEELDAWTFVLQRDKDKVQEP